MTEYQVVKWKCCFGYVYCLPSWTPKYQKSWSIDQSRNRSFFPNIPGNIEPDNEIGSNIDLTARYNNIIDLASEWRFTVLAKWGRIKGKSTNLVKYTERGCEKWVNNNIILAMSKSLYSAPSGEFVFWSALISVCPSWTLRRKIISLSINLRIVTYKATQNSFLFLFRCHSFILEKEALTTYGETSKGWKGNGISTDQLYRFHAS